MPAGNSAFRARERGGEPAAHRRGGRGAQGDSGGGGTPCSGCAPPAPSARGQGRSGAPGAPRNPRGLPARLLRAPRRRLPRFPPRVAAARGRRWHRGGRRSAPVQRREDGPSLRRVTQPPAATGHFHKSRRAAPAALPQPLLRPAPPALPLPQSCPTFPGPCPPWEEAARGWRRPPVPGGQRAEVGHGTESGSGTRILPDGLIFLRLYLHGDKKC